MCIALLYVVCGSTTTPLCDVISSYGEPGAHSSPVLGPQVQKRQVLAHTLQEVYVQEDNFLVHENQTLYTYITIFSTPYAHYKINNRVSGIGEQAVEI